jgi:L-rhamnose mutarotase
LVEETLHRSCRLLEVREGCEAEYDRRHRTIWPELAAEIRRVYATFTVFRSGRVVVVYGEQRESVAAASEVGERWVVYMADVLEPNTLELREVMHLP